MAELSDRSAHFEKLEAELREAAHWLETIRDVADNDPDATQNWYIPAQIVDWQGYNMDYFWKGVEHYPDNETKNEYFQDYVGGIILELEERREAAAMDMDYDDYLDSERG